MAEKEQPAYVGHRKRVRQHIEEFGFDNLSSTDLLEYLLFFALPRCDTYTLSRKLISKFGSLREVFCATVDELCEIDGIGKESAYFLTAFIPAFRIYSTDGLKKIPLTKLSDILRFMRAMVMGTRSETFVVLYLDPKKSLIRHEVYSTEDWDIVSVSMEKILRKAVSLKAVSVIIGHNHLTGKLFPSNEDVESTSILKGKLDTIGVKLLDSIIFDEYDFYSFNESEMV